MDAERSEAKSYREKTNDLLSVINANVTKLSPQDVTKVRTAIGTLHTAKDFQQDYPELYKKMEEATSFPEAAAVGREIIARKIAKRISDEPSCQNIKLDTYQN